MLQTIEEVRSAEKADPGVVNGVDNPNLMSVDSTEPVATSVEKLDENGKVVEGEIEEEVEKKSEESEKSEESSEVKEEIEEIEEAETEEEEEEEDDKFSNASKRVQKRIGELTKKWRTSERESHAKAARIEELEKKIEELSAKIPSDDKPQKEDFEDEDEFIEALTDWKIEQKLAATQKKKSSETSSQEQMENIVDVYEGIDTATERGIAKYPNFQEVTTAEDLVLSAEVVQLALETESPEDVLYYLGTNPDESERISSLSAVKSAREIVELERALKRQQGKRSPAKTKQSSRAPEPIKPIKSAGVTEKDPNKMTPAEYRRWRKNQK